MSKRRQAARRSRRLRTRNAATSTVPATPSQEPNRRTMLMVAGFIVLVFAVAAAFVVVARLSRDDDASASDILNDTEQFTIAERNHVEGAVAYAQTPPVGGNHAPVWQNCGYYEAPIISENGVHSLEHGAVWITYRPDLPADQVESLRQEARAQTFVLVSPFPGLPAPVVASAWGRQLKLETAGDPRLRQFIRAFRVGPQTPEPGAPCVGGRGG